MRPADVLTGVENPGPRWGGGGGGGMGPCGGGAEPGRGQLEAGPRAGRPLRGRRDRRAVTSPHDWVFMNERNPVSE